VALFDQKLAASKRHSAAGAEALHLDHIVKMLAAKPAELVKNADLPIKDLGIDETGSITISGRPVKSLSTSEQIRLALDIARAVSGELKIICLDGFESIVGEAREELMKQINADSYQYFITESAVGEVEISKAG
jgi:ABC-type branched-subunit amino acid transport system ATPase component